MHKHIIQTTTLNVSMLYIGRLYAPLDCCCCYCCCPAAAQCVCVCACAPLVTCKPIDRLRRYRAFANRTYLICT